ncbi:MAG: hypothetical protein JO225_02705 [Candidatus Eremiobacteraeota bacterium]|nr:hypothetical protein [Candidatus Eremiobacteraeota bacterium]
MPRPRKRIARGISATDGTGRSSSTTVRSASCTSGTVPISTPTRTATTVASASPSAKLSSVAATWLDSSPLRNPSPSASATADGGGT